MRMTIIINNCKQCPYFGKDGKGLCLDENMKLQFFFLCNHPSWKKRKQFQDMENGIPNWCPEKTSPHCWVKLPRDEVLSDFLEERGYEDVADQLRGLE